MENEEEDIDFEELSKEYPLFFSSSKDFPIEKYYPSPKSPKPISDDPKIYLDYDDYILDERISNLKFYPNENESNDLSNKTTKSRPNSPSSILSTNTETKISPLIIKNHNSSKNSSTLSKNRSSHFLDISQSHFPKKSHPVSDLNHVTTDIFSEFEDFDKSKNKFKETRIQAPKNIIKKKFNTAPPPQPQTSLHSGYPLLFDYQPKYPQRHQKLQNGTEKTFYNNGDILVHFLSGKEKIYHQNIILTKFKNGDILQEFLDGSTAYRYGNTGTIELTLPDHTSIIQYLNGQREKRNPEGETIVKFSDGIFMKVDADGNWTMVKSKT